MKTTMSAITATFFLVFGAVVSNGSPVQRISDETGVSVDTLQAERTSTGLGWGELETAHLLSNASGQSFGDLVALHQGGEGWGKIARDNGLKLGDIVSAAQRSSHAKTINFDTINALSNPVGGTTLKAYLARYGVTISNVTPGSQVVVDDDRRSYGGGVVFASSPHNFLSNYFLNAPNSFTLNFAGPLSSVSFTRIAGGPYPTIYASWTATALSANGTPLAQVSEASPGVANFPAKVFTLNGPGIMAVRWDSNGFGFAAFSAVLLDDLILNSKAH
jgi:hypothetical protein